MAQMILANPMRCLDAGVIVTEPQAPLWHRIAELQQDVGAKIEAYLCGDNCVGVVESPSRGVHRMGNPVTIPMYGCAVGVCMGEIMRHSRRFVATSFPRPDEWTKGRWTTSTKNDPLKRGRVRDACSYYHLTPEDLGRPTEAGNVADALLMSVWVANRIQRAAPIRLITFDPSLTCTGYAVVEMES